VSINVSVASILSDDYIKTLRSAIDDAYLGPQKVTLEISEKDAIEPPTGQIWLPNPMQFFLDRLTRIASSLRVHFAVDDFGVGHASLDRLATLTLTQIKIDPAILRHPRGLDELELVTKVANEVFHRGGAPISRAIVVEGVDRDCPIPLSDIYAAGIQFVQGYIVEQAASADLRPLTEETCQLIAGLVRGETGMHDPAPSTSLA
jgi:EAL domain-containing protein (putative c-di-GMP-specific phosphodiesterase class I)